MILTYLAPYDIVLGSASPRRRELLKGLDIHFRVETKKVDENFPSELSGTEVPVHIAKKKSLAFDLQENTLLITADTIVSLNGKIYGKPTHETDAKKVLKELSGKTHQVTTGVCVRTLKKISTFHVTTDVTFSELTGAEINYYIDRYRPYDKAGAYGIQEWIGYIAPEQIKGSFYNVMGLPVQQLYQELKKWR